MKNFDCEVRRGPVKLLPWTDFELFRVLLEGSLGVSSEGQSGPGRLNAPQKGRIKGAEAGSRCVP